MKPSEALLPWACIPVGGDTQWTHTQVNKDPSAVGCYEYDKQACMIQNKMKLGRERIGTSCIGENVLEQMTLALNPKWTERGWDCEACNIWGGGFSSRGTSQRSGDQSLLSSRHITRATCLILKFSSCHTQKSQATDEFNFHVFHLASHIQYVVFSFQHIINIKIINEIFYLFYTVFTRQSAFYI